MTWALTFHILGVALLFGLLHLPMTVVRGIAAWKEIAGVLLVIVVVVRAAFGRGPGVAIASTDLLAGGWLGLTIVTFLTEGVVMRNFVPVSAALFGLRDAAFFVLFYFVGRATPEVVKSDALARRAFMVLLITGGVALLEQILITPQMLVLIGVGSYVRDFLGTEAYTQGNIYGLPDNYWSLMGGHLVRRSGSVFLSSQGFAQIFVVFLPLATLWALRNDARRTLRRHFGYAIIWAGLLVTFTRAAIAIGVLQLVAILAWRRRSTGIAIAGAVGLVVFVVGMVAVPGLATFVMETLMWQTGSSASHMKDWTSGVAAFIEQPWGYGLGTTDQSAVRGGLEPITADNLYLKYAVEMGLPGLLLLTGTLVSFIGAGVRVARLGGDEHQRGLGLTVALATLGIVVYGFTSVIFSNPIVAYLLFWFAGSAVTLSQRTEPRTVPVAVSYA